MARNFVELALRPHVYYYTMAGERCPKETAVRADLKLTADHNTPPLSFDLQSERGKADLTLALKMFESCYQRGKQHRSEEIDGLISGARHA